MPQKKSQKKPGRKSSQTQTAPDASIRIIKKYPNRRLYDTTTSAYITVADVKALVMAATPFVVQDAKTEQDLTRSILLQIILEEESAGAPLFSEAVLAHMIRAYGHTMQGFLGAYLERNMQLFNQMPMTDGIGSTPQEQMHQAQDWMTHSQQLLTQMQEQMLGLFGVKK